MTKPLLYKKLFENFAGKQLPDEKALALRIALGQYGITKEASEYAAKVFIESVEFAGLLDDNNYLSAPIEISESQEETSFSEEEGTIPETQRKEMPSQGTGLDKYEFTLQSAVKISLLLPPTLSKNDKERLKKLIDLIPEQSNIKAGV